MQITTKLNGKILIRPSKREVSVLHQAAHIIKTVAIHEPAEMADIPDRALDAIAEFTERLSLLSQTPKPVTPTDPQMSLLDSTSEQAEPGKGR